jgi:SAM-dependent methyltransferase
VETRGSRLEARDRKGCSTSIIKLRAFSIKHPTSSIEHPTSTRWHYIRPVNKIIALLTRFVPRKYLQLFSGIGLKFLGFVYAGNAVECVVCSKRYRTFLPYGRLSSRPNALCPNCLSLERHRLIWLYLNEKTDFFKRKLSVLHIAPEHCFMKDFERQHGEGYITADIESPLAKVKMDIHEMPFGENQFDVVLCNHVLEHVKDDIKALSEIKRVLKPGGWAILLVPFFNPIGETTFEDNSITNARERERIFGQSDHVRKYGKDYPNRIKQAGLGVIEDQFAFSMSKEIQFKLGLSPEIIYRAEKSS